MDTNILRLSILVIIEEGKSGKKGPCILTCKQHHLLARLIFLGNETYFLTYNGSVFPGIGGIQLILYLEIPSSPLPFPPLPENLSGFWEAWDGGGPFRFYLANTMTWHCTPAWELLLWIFDLGLANSSVKVNYISTTANVKHYIQCIIRWCAKSVCFDQCLAVNVLVCT